MRSTRLVSGDGLVRRAAVRLCGASMVLFSLGTWGCSNGEHLVLSEAPPDSTPLQGDTTITPPSDSVPLPPDSSLLPPNDSSPPPPPDTTSPLPPDSMLPPADPPVHSGIPFGPFVYTK